MPPGASRTTRVLSARASLVRFATLFTTRGPVLRFKAGNRFFVFVAGSSAGRLCVFSLQLMIRSEGVQALFGGYVVHLQRACLQNGIMFLVFEHFVHSMGRKRDPGGR